MIDILIIAVLLVAAILLLLTELFFIPGISLAGLAAAACLIYANIYAFAHLGVVGGWITLAISAVTTIASLIFFMRSKMLDRIALNSSIDSQIDRSAEESLRVGDEGITTTRLALIGYADFDGKIVEVKSTGEFIDAKTPIVVHRIVDGIILVEPA